MEEAFSRRRRLDDERSRKFLGIAALDPRVVVGSFVATNDSLSSTGIKSNHMSAVVDRSRFDASLVSARIDMEALRKNDGNVVELDFEPETHIQYLSEEARADIIEEQVCEQQQSSDGELFYRLSLHWGTYKNDVSPPDNKWLDELLRYLRRIDHFWSQICPTSEIKRKVDAATIEILDNQAPGSVQEAFDQNDLFINLDDAQRDLVWTRILEATRDRTVPTVHSFFRNLGYLGAVAYSMDRLRDPPPSKRPTKDRRQKRKKRPEFKRDSRKKVSLRQGFQDGFQKDAMDNHVIQASENCYKLVHAEHIDGFELGYQTLWAFCLRWHPMLPRLESDHRVIGETDQEQSVLAHFAKLAHRIGFRSSRINDIQQQSTATGLANRQEVSGSLGTLSSHDALNELIGAGKPSKKALENMRHMLFVPNFYNTTAEMLAFPPFFVQRSLYLDIFSSCQADAITTMLCTGLQGQDHIIVEAQNERRLEDNVERCLGRQLAEARDTISQLRNSLKALQVEHAICGGLKAELEKRSLASLKQAQDAEFSRSVLQQQLHDLQHSRSKSQWAAPGHRKLLQSNENDQQPLQAGPDQEKATAGGNTPLALPDSDMPDWDLDVSNEAPPYQWSSSQEDLDIRFEDASSQYSQPSLLAPPDKPDSQLFQVKILSDTWGDDKIVQVNEEYLLNFVGEFQDKGYKIFDNADRVLTPYAAANLSLSERYIVLKPYFDITTQQNGHSRPA
ncbi:hypothetical protein AU210_016440 [Fusarium oxysporum f. sp. radicis-cucumerinum]|uniref:Uncharacterized protein n=1 Tax=Fusarium oxysporum f. sp. radicis-cucumerinum TaxID=327505 RepID=A0A2H3G0P8_FUSOX|nr:hypothetical protein AU210_016440 [Fusarium oxysporum f. sp. radicis-cucumerinum]